MSQQNVEIVRRVFEAVGRHDTETVLSAYDPNVEVDFLRRATREPDGRQRLSRI